MTERLARRGEIKKVATALKSREFPRLVVFADMLTRYIDIKFEGKVNWVRAIALMHIVSRGGSLTASQLGRLMLRPNYSMTGLIDDLEKDGLVARERTGKDRRTIDVRLTAAGLAFIMQCFRDTDLVEDEAMFSLDKNEIDMLRNLIRILRQTLIEKTSKHPDAWVYYSRGISYKALGKKAEAVADLKTCIELSRDRSLTKAARRELNELLGE